MQPTTFSTIPIPASGSPAPTGIAYATKVPVRVLVRNVGGVAAIIGPTSGDVAGSQGPSRQSTVLLPPGASDVYVLAPQQKLYAVGAGAGGLLCISVAEAVPIDIPMQG